MGAWGEISESRRAPCVWRTAYQVQGWWGHKSRVARNRIHKNRLGGNSLRYVGVYCIGGILVACRSSWSELEGEEGQRGGTAQDCGDGAGAARF